MIHINEIKDLIEKNKAPFIKVRDMSENLLFEITDTDNTATAGLRFEDAALRLAEYGKVIVEAATEAQYKQNYRTCFRWVAFFGSKKGELSGVDPGGNSQKNMSGYISLAEMEAKITNIRLQQQIDELKQVKKFELPELPASYVFLAGEVLGWDEMKTSKLVSGLSGGAPAPAPGAKVSMSQDEEAQAKHKLEQIENLVISVIGKIEADKIIRVLTAVNNNPSLIDKIIPFI